MPGERFFKEVLRDPRGSSAVEYGFILGLIVIVLIAALTGFTGETLQLWTHVETEAAKAHRPA
jgi:Flp pilus assembly pilin Flp